MKLTINDDIGYTVFVVNDEWYKGKEKMSVEEIYDLASYDDRAGLSEGIKIMEDKKSI